MQLLNELFSFEEVKNIVISQLHKPPKHLEKVYVGVGFVHLQKNGNRKSIIFRNLVLGEINFNRKKLNNHFNGVSLFYLDRLGTSLSGDIANLDSKDGMLVFFLIKNFSYVVPPENLPYQLIIYPLGGELDYVQWQFEFVKFIMELGGSMFVFLNSIFNSLINQVIHSAVEQSGELVDLDTEKSCIVRRFNLLRKISEFIGLRGKALAIFYNLPFAVDFVEGGIYHITFDNLVFSSDLLEGGWVASLYDLDLLFVLHTRYLIKALKLKTRRADYLTFSYFKYISKSEIDFGNFKLGRGRKRFITLYLSKITPKKRLTRKKNKYSCPGKLIPAENSFIDCEVFGDFILAQLNPNTNSNNMSDNFIYTCSVRDRNNAMFPILSLEAIPLLLLGFVGSYKISNYLFNRVLYIDFGSFFNDYLIFSIHGASKWLLPSSVIRFLREKFAKVKEKSYILLLELPRKKFYFFKPLNFF